MLDSHADGCRIKSSLSWNNFLVIVIVNMLKIAYGVLIIIIVVISVTISF